MIARAMNRTFAALLLLFFSGVGLGAELKPGDVVFTRFSPRTKPEKPLSGDESVPFGCPVREIDGDWVLLQDVWVHREDILSPGEALAYYTEQVDRKGDCGLVWACRGFVRKHLGDSDGAISDLQHAVLLDRNNANAYAGLAQLRHRNNEHEAAVRYWTKAIEIEPASSQFFHGRAMSLMDLGHLDEAAADLSEAIRINPRFAVAFYNRGIAWRDQQQIDKAFADFSEAVRIDPGYSNAHAELGHVLRLKGEGEEAIKELSRSIDLDPTNDTAFLNRAICFAAIEKYDQAILDLDAYLRLKSDNDAYRFRGTLLNEAGRFDEAIKDFGEAIRLDPADAGAYAGRAESWMRKGEHQRVVQDTTKAIEIDPEIPHAYALRAAARKAAKDYVGAVADLTEVVRLVQAPPAVYNNRGNALRAMGEPDRALRDFDEAIRLDPSRAARTTIAQPCGSTRVSTGGRLTTRTERSSSICILRPLGTSGA